MDLHAANEKNVLQILRWGAVSQERVSPADTMFVTAGRQIYAIGDIDGRFRPRSNPYDLHALGHPHPEDPLAGKLQGVWAQPVKGVNRYGVVIEANGEIWKLEDAISFTQRFASADFEFRRGALEVARRDFAALDLPLVISMITLRNRGGDPLEIRVHFTVEFDLQDAWFTTLAEHRNQGETVTLENNCLVARAEAAPGRWAAAAGCAQPAEAYLLSATEGELVVAIPLEAGVEREIVFGMTVESQGGAPAALRTLVEGLGGSEALLKERQDLYDSVSQNGPDLVSPDPALNAAFALARANLHMLEAAAPSLGRYFYAGLEMFPFWFSNDGAYSIPGLAASGLGESARNHIQIGLEHLDQGRVPHQISPSGRVAFAGNAQETPLWVVSIWDAYRWTGDREFLARLYPGAWTGMFDYVLGAIDADGDGYPSGPGMVEVEGMGAEKLDSAAYTWSALNALAQMADALGRAADAIQARARAAQIADRFETDWWDAAGGLYAMSLEDPGNAQFPVPHWAVIVPLEVGLATPEHAAQTFSVLRARFLNRWGLKHTVGEDERVWTLPTATLSRAAYRYGEKELGAVMLKHITDTLGQGSIGLFHELIPEGACFLQLWSAATFVRGVIEDLLGVEVNAGQHRLCVAPQIPEAWPEVSLERLEFGGHRVTLRVSRGSLRVEHLAGPTSLSLVAGGQQHSLAVGESVTVEVSANSDIDKPI